MSSVLVEAESRLDREDFGSGKRVVYIHQIAKV